MRRLLSTAVVAVVAVGTTSAGYAVAAADGDDPPPLGPGLVTLEVEMHYSRYSIPEHLRVYEGTLVEFVVTNHDPINHELIIGDEDVHARHANGHEKFHPPVPGEVSLGPDERGLTTYLFDHAGTVRYVCHLPGHEQYGMQGEFTVVPAD
jgi:uncharacterized cupredoxin-like copper-binding protein